MADPIKQYRDKESGVVKSQTELKEAGYSDKDINEWLKQGYIVEHTGEVKKKAGSPASSPSSEPSGSSTDVETMDENSSESPGTTNIRDIVGGNNLEDLTRIPVGQPQELPDPMSLPMPDPREGLRNPSESTSLGQRQLDKAQQKFEAAVKQEKLDRPRLQSLEQQVRSIMDTPENKAKYYSIKKPQLMEKPEPDSKYTFLNNEALDELLGTITQAGGQQVTDQDRQRIRTKIIGEIESERMSFDIMQKAMQNYKLENGKIELGKIDLKKLAQQGLQNASESTRVPGMTPAVAQDMEVPTITQVGEDKNLTDKFGRPTDPMTVLSGNRAQATKEAQQQQVNEFNAKMLELQDRQKTGQITADQANLELTQYKTKLQGSLDDLIEQRVNQLNAKSLPNVFAERIAELEKEIAKDPTNDVKNDPIRYEMGQLQARIDKGETYDLRQDPRWRKAISKAVKDQIVENNEKLKAFFDNTEWNKPLDRNAPFRDQRVLLNKSLTGLFSGLGQMEQMTGGILNMYGHYSLGNHLTDKGKEMIEGNAIPAQIDEQGNSVVMDSDPSTWIARNVFAQVPTIAGLMATAEVTGGTSAALLSRIGMIKKAGGVIKGALGGLMTTVPEAFMEMGDYYNKAIAEGKTPEQAQRGAQEVFVNNAFILGLSNPVEYGMMKLPTKKLMGKIGVGALESQINGVQEVLQEWAQTRQDNKALSIMDYALSPEGQSVYMSGAVLGVTQSAVMGAYTNWNVGRETNKMFDFNSKGRSENTADFPSNNSIARTVLNSFNMKDTQGRDAELKRIVQDYKDAGVYTEDEANLVSDIIDDVKAVKDNIPSFASSEQSAAIFNELLQIRENNKRKQQSGIKAVEDLFDQRNGESEKRIQRIMTGEEPLYFVGGNETNKQQLLDALQNPSFAKTAGKYIRIVNDPETQSAVDEILNLSKKAKAENTAQADQVVVDTPTNPADISNPKTDDDANAESTTTAGRTDSSDGGTTEQSIIEFLRTDPELSNSKKPVVQGLRSFIGKDQDAEIIKELRQQVSNPDQFKETFGENLYNLVSSLGAENVGRSNEEMTADLDNQVEQTRSGKTPFEQAQAGDVVSWNGDEWTLKDKVSSKLYPDGRWQLTREANGGTESKFLPADEFNKNVSLSKKGGSNAVQEQSTTTDDVRDQPEGGEKVPEGNAKGQKATGEGAPEDVTEKVTRFGSPKNNMDRNVFSLYNEYQDQIIEQGGNDEFEKYDEQMLSALDSEARSRGLKLKPAELEKLHTSIMSGVYDDAGVQDNQEKTLRQVIDEALNNYSPKKQNNESNRKTAPGRGVRMRGREVATESEEVAPVTEKPESSPVQEQTSTEPPARDIEAEKRKKVADAIAQFKKTVAQSRGQLNIGVDPKVIADGVNMLTAFADLGIYKFKEIVREMVEAGREFFADQDNVNALKGVYSYYRSNLTPAERREREMENEDQVDTFIEAELPGMVAVGTTEPSIGTTDPNPGTVEPEPAPFVDLGREKKRYIFVGKNSEGENLYEDSNGVRALDRGRGIFVNESVNIIPTKSGIRTSRNVREAEFLTTDEIQEQNEPETGNIAGSTSTETEGTPEGGASGILRPDGEQQGTGQVSGREGEPVLSTDRGNATERPASDTGRGNSLGRNDADTVVNRGRRHPSDPVLTPTHEGRNYVIPGDFSHGTTFGVAQKFKDNIAAIQVVDTLLEESRNATPEEQAILAKYVGFGGLKEVLFDPKNDRDWKDSNKNLRQYVQQVYDLAEKLENKGLGNVLEDVKGSILNAHYTSIPIIRGIYYGIQKAGFTGGKILEPSAGIGNFIGAMPHELMAKSQIAAIEKDAITGHILKYLYPDSRTFIGGLEDSNTPDNYFDLTISNIPFGDIKVFDKDFRNSKISALRESTKRIHTYFFAKGLNTTRPGGLVAFVTSKGVLDSADNAPIRKYISEQAEFLGAIRLPNTAFQVNANTEVVTDIIFLRKFNTGEKASQKHAFMEQRSKNAKHKNDGTTYEVSYNEYFHNNPENMFGTVAAGGLYRAEEFFLVGKKNEDLETRIREAANKIFPEKVYTKSSNKASDPDALKEYYIEKSQQARVGNIILQKGKPVKITSVGENGYLVQEFSGSVSKKQISNYVKLRDSLNELFAAELQDRSDKEVEKLRKNLNDAYDNYVSNHKQLLHRDNGKLLSLDVDGYNVRALERVNKDGEFEKSDIFFRRTVKPYKVVEKSENVQEATAVSLNEYGFVNMDRITALTGKTAEQVMEDAKGFIYEDPEGGYVTTDEYLSGNVKKKLAAAQKAAEVDSRFEYNVEALKKVIPEDIKTSEIEVRIGARWVDEKYYQEFARELFAMGDLRVRYLSGSDAYKVGLGKGRISVELESFSAKDENGRDRLSGADILQDALMSRTPRVMDHWEDENGNKKQSENRVATQNAIEKYNIIREKFQSWIWKDTERREYLSRKYNDTFNNTIKRKYDGSLLSFSGMVGIDLMQHQKDGVWMIAQNMGGVIDHIVGAGKTYLMVAASMEMKRMGLIKKPMIVALKANAAEIADDFQKVYPLARVLAPKESDFTPKKRKALLAQIANNDWDAIVITHDNFGKIPHSVEMQQELINEELALLEADIDQLKEESEDGLSKNQLKALQKRKENLETKLKELASQAKDTELRTFQELGVDKLFIDESQQFKNLEYSTKLRGIAGLGPMAGSKRAFNMLLGVRTLQKVYRGDKGTTFLSGTPISNSMVEMYLILKYLRPRKLEELGMSTFDSWVTTFATNYADVEFSVTGALGSKDRFREFINVPELSILYNEIADVRNDSNLKLDKPSMKGGNYILKMVPQSEQQKEYSNRLIEFVKSKGSNEEALGLGPLTDNQKKAFGLLATGLSTKLAIDMRLIFPYMEDNPNGKIAVAADLILGHYKDSDVHKGTQLVFSDMGTPKSGNVREDLRDYLQEEEGVNDDDIELIFGTGETMPDMKIIKERMAEVLEYTPEKIEESIVNAKNSEGSFNVYSDLKKKLINRGIPSDEIAFIHDYKTKAARKVLFTAVRQGKIRVLIGSTAKLGTGVNVQDRVVAMYHIDVPWRPSDMEQRNGRGIRQRNWVAKLHYNNEVPVYALATELTLDAYKYQLLEGKNRFINQIKDGSVGERIVHEEAGDDSEVGLNEIIAALSGNPDILTKAKLERKVQALDKSRKNFEQEQFDAERKIDTRRNQIAQRKRWQAEIAPDLAALESKYGEGGVPVLKPQTDFVIGGIAYGTKYKEAGKAIIDERRDMLNKPAGTEKEIGTVFGFPIKMRVRALSGKGLAVDTYLQGSVGQYSVESALDEVWTSRYAQDAVFDLYKKKDLYQREIDQFTEDIPKLQELLKKKFEKTEELESARKDLAEVQKRLSDSVAEDNAPAQPQENLDDEIKAEIEAIRKELGNTLPSILPLNVLPQLTRLAGLYIRKGLKTAAQMAKALGVKLQKVLVDAWNAGKKAVQDYWNESQNMGVISPSMRRFMSANAPTGGGGGSSSNTNQSAGTSNQSQPKAKTSLQKVEEMRRKARENAEQMWKDIEKEVFGAISISDTDFDYTPSIFTKVAGTIGKIEDWTIGKITDASAKRITNAAKAGLEQKNKYVRGSAKALNSVFANIGKSTEDILRAEKFHGEARVKSISDAIEFSKQIRKIVDNNPDSLLNVQKVLDPEAYQKMDLEDFKKAVATDIGQDKVDKMDPTEMDARYNEYLTKYGFNDPNYKPPTRDDLRPEEKSLYDIIRAAYDMIHELTFAMGKTTVDTYENNKGKYSARLYDKYEVPKEVEEAFGRNNPAVKVDESLYKARTELSEWKLLHRLEDPIYAVSKRLYQTMANKAIIDYAAHIVENNKDVVSNVEQPGFRKLGRGYGALSNRWVRDDVAEEFIGYFYADRSLQLFYDFVKGYDKLAIRQFYKKLFTVWNPGVHVGNIMGNIIFGQLTGINFMRLTSNVGWAMDQISNYGPEYRYALGNGLLKTDFTQADLINSMQSLEKALDENSQTWFGNIKDKVEGFYGATDDVFKLAAFRSLLEQGKSPQEALNEVKRGFQNYQRVGKAYDLFSKVPLVGQPFGKFAGDLQRIVGASITRHPLQTMMFLGVLRLLGELASNLSGETDEEKRIRESRVGAPKIPLPDAVGGDILLEFKIGKNVLNVARLLSPIFLYSSADDDNAFEFTQKLSPLPIDIPDYTNNPNGKAAVFIGQNVNDPMWAPLVQLMANSDFRGKPIIDPKETKFKPSTLTDAEKAKNSLLFMARGYVPYWPLGADIIQAIRGEEDYYGRTRNVGQVMLNLVGAKVTQFPETRYGEILKQRMESFGYKWKDENRVVKDLTKQRAEGKISQDVYEKRVAPHLENMAVLTKRAQEEYTRLTGKAGGVNLKKEDILKAAEKSVKRGRGSRPGRKARPSRNN